MGLATLTAMVLAALVAPSAVAGSVECQVTEPDPTDGPSWVSKMPKATATSVTTEDFEVESKDGTGINLRVYLPDNASGPLPTVLKMTPYNAFAGYYKEFEDAGNGNQGLCWLLTRGYAFVLGDVRGTHNSDGCMDLGGPKEQEDGYAVVQWIAQQKWSNGNVGMYGVSYDGMSQYSAAVKSPPALKAIIPIAPVSSWWRYLYSGGVHYETNMGTPGAMEYGVALPPPSDAGDPDYPDSVTQSTCNSELVARGMSLDGTLDKFWKKRDYSLMAKNIKAAVFHAHGWLDENVKLDHFDAIWEALERYDVPRKALIGPWTHAEPQVPMWHLTAVRWFEHWLHDNDTGMMNEPTVTYIDQSKMVRTADTWPATPKELVLSVGNGNLRERVEPGEASYQDVFMIQRSQLRSTESARLIYTGEPLKTPVRLSGTPTFTLAAAIDQQDTNFVVHLYDVDPNGNARYVSRGYLDARLRNGLSKPEPVPPGERQDYTIELHGRDYIFAKGNRIEVLISSSDSCHWGVAPGCTSSGVISDTTAAVVTVYEGTGTSRLVLPLGPLKPARLLAVGR